MTLQASTGLRNKILDTSSLKASLAGCVLKIFSGAPPATADAAQTGTLLTTISDNSTGATLTFGTASAGTLPKNASQVWSGVNAATGTAGYFRIVLLTGEDGTSSTTQVRLQGLVGVAGSDVNMSSVNLTAAATQTMDAANITLPAL